MPQFILYFHTFQRGNKTYHVIKSGFTYTNFRIIQVLEELPF